MNTRQCLLLVTLLFALLLAPGTGARAGGQSTGGTVQAGTSGIVLAWGIDTLGQLGDGSVGSPAYNPTPTAVPGASGVVAVAGGFGYSLALKSDGTVLTWGNGTPTPTVVPGVSGVAALAGGFDHALALTTNGTLLAWGDDSYGQLGDGTVGSPTNNPTPQIVPGVSGITAIAAGYHFSLALKNDGTLLAWGVDDAGQLGDGSVGSPGNNPTPKAVLGASGVAAIAAGYYHSLALKTDGTLLAWGSDSAGQLGDGTVGSPTNNATPKAVPGVSGVAAIAAGFRRNLVLKTEGTLLAWGDDSTGALGDGTIGSPNNDPTPKAVPGVSGVAAIAAGVDHMLALKSDGTLLAWGDDGVGELGDGTVGSPDADPIPKAVPGVGSVLAIVASNGHNLVIKTATSPSPSPSPSPSALPTFGDLTNQAPATVEAIRQLAARGIINGCDSSATPPLFCPDEPTLRHQMAALIVRAIPAWVSETGLPTFSDNTADTELMTRVATLQRHGVVRGYQDAVCRDQGTAPPCYGPLDTVKYGQVMLFVARAMEKAGYWTLQPDDRTIFPDQNGAAGADPATDQQTLDHRAVVTYVHYVGNPPDVANVHANFVLSSGQGWNDASTRAWFARAFWPAIQGH